MNDTVPPKGLGKNMSLTLSRVSYQRLQRKEALTRA